MRKTLERALMLSLILTLALSTAAYASQTVRIGLYFNAANNTNAVDWIKLTGSGGLAASFIRAERLDLPVSYASVTLEAGSGQYVQVGSSQTFEAAWRLAQETRSTWNYRAYVVFRMDSTPYPYKVWVEGAAVAVRIHYRDAFNVNAAVDSVRLRDDTGSNPGLLAVDGMGFLLTPVSPTPTRVAAAGQFTRLYAGAFEVRTAAGRISTVNVLDLEQYVAGVVPFEMSDSWPLEALKAQAVAARSYALANLNKHRALGFDLCDSPACCQKYAGFDLTATNSPQAVSATAGRVARFNGQVAELFYHSSSGGHTENSEDVWAGRVGYARAVSDPLSLAETLLAHLFSRNAPNNNSFPARWVRSHQRAELEHSANLNVGTILEISSVARSSGGRHTALAVRGTAGEVLIERNRIRPVFGLPSTLFEIIPVHHTVSVVGAGGIVHAIPVNSAIYLATADGSQAIAPGIMDVHLSNGEGTRAVTLVPIGFTFDGRGWGHGVGMSQWGAFEKARRGFNYEQILSFYFQGITIGTQ